MLKFILNLIYILYLFLISTAFSQKLPQKDYLPGELIIKFSPTVDFIDLSNEHNLKSGISSVDRLTAEYPLIEAVNLFTQHSSSTSQRLVLPNSEVIDIPDLSNIYRLRFSPELDIMAVLSEIKNDPGVVFAEPNYIARISGSTNDPFNESQWGLHKVQIDSAWSISTGIEKVVIGILDTGIDWVHEDLAENIWINQDEIPNNGIDDDSNGYIDDFYGWNFVNGTNNPMDNTGHGTHVAGISSAVTNNNIGIAGVSWHSKLMNVKVLDIDGQGLYSSIAEGIMYAASNGAKIINMSFGGYHTSVLLETALLNAYATCLLVGSAGNDNRMDKYYPAAYPYVMSVAGVDSNDVKWQNSNYGSWVSVSAPAEEIFSTKTGNNYGSLSGTSMAAAFVSGTAALLFSKDTALSPPAVFNQMINTSETIDSKNQEFTGLLGSGRINAFNTVLLISKPVLGIIRTHTDDSMGGDNDQILDAGENVDLFISLYNYGKSVYNISSELITADTMVLVSQAFSPYGDISARDSSVNQIAFNVNISFDILNNHLVEFQLVLNGDEFSDTLSFGMIAQKEFNLSGLISADQTLAKDYIYTVTGNVLVNAGVTLTIEPGVVLNFNEGKSIQINGTLIARGTEEEKIIFTSDQPLPTPGYWENLIFADQSGDAQYDGLGNYLSGCILEHCIVEYGKGIKINSSTPYINSSDIRSNLGNGIAITRYGLFETNKFNNLLVEKNYGDGIYCDANGSIEVKNSKIIENTGRGIYQTNAASSLVVQKSMISNNRGRGIHSLYAYDSGDVFSENVIWGNSGALALHGGKYLVSKCSFSGNTENDGSVMVVELLFGQDINVNFNNNSLINNSGNYSIVMKPTDSNTEFQVNIHNNNIENYAVYEIYNNNSRNVNADNNWWGTTSAARIDSLIYDFFDNVNLGLVDYNPVLSQANSVAPPYIWRLSTNPPNPVGAQLVEFILDFNKQMDTLITPSIVIIDSSGTIFRVKENSLWIGNDRFKSAVNINEMFRSGYYTIEIEGAKDISGLEIPKDTTYSLLVYTAGAASKQLNATITGGVVRLVWNPSCISNLLGYNLYRSQTSGNNYSKLNQNIITDTLFVDTLLNGPGRYYYVYTVVDGNFNESSFSTEAFVITTDIITENNVPAEYSLANNFPNPFNPITTISYSLDVNSFVTLDIYNVIGEKVENLVKEFQNSGNHRINFNAVNLPSGIYFYALVSNNRVLVKKMTIIK